MVRSRVYRANVITQLDMNIAHGNKFDLNDIFEAYKKEKNPCLRGEPYRFRAAYSLFPEKTGIYTSNPNEVMKKFCDKYRLNTADFTRLINLYGGRHGISVSYSQVHTYLHGRLYKGVRKYVCPKIDAMAAIAEVMDSWNRTTDSLIELMGYTVRR